MIPSTSKRKVWINIRILNNGTNKREREERFGRIDSESDVVPVRVAAKGGKGSLPEVLPDIHTYLLMGYGYGHGHEKNVDYYKASLNMGRNPSHLPSQSFQCEFDFRNGKRG